MILLIDNYDSFTYNLLHYLSELGAKVKVMRNDVKSAEDILSMQELEGIVISPGPCTPNEAGVCLELVEKVRDQVPLLGVCLGHETIGQVFGGKVVRVHPMHGKVSIVEHTQQGIFANIPSPFRATRYHSLVVEKDSLPDCLKVTAHSDDGLIMGLQHKEYSIHGVQFHPESIASEQGHAILKNFLELCS